MKWVSMIEVLLPMLKSQSILQNVVYNVNQAINLLLDPS